MNQFSSVQSVYNMLDAVGAKPKDDPCARAGIIHSSSGKEFLWVIKIKLNHPKLFVLNTFCPDEIFTRIDVDNDGELNVQEFMKGCQEDQVRHFSFLMKRNKVPNPETKKIIRIWPCSEILTRQI